MLVGVWKVFDVERHIYGSLCIVFIVNYIIESLMYDRDNVQMLVLTCATSLMMVSGEERKGSQRAASLSEYGRRRVGNLSSSDSHAHRATGKVWNRRTGSDLSYDGWIAERELRL